jgi:hypothetical protein
MPERQEELGLEIPLEIMTALASVRHTLHYEGGVVLKGFFMYVPVQRHEDRV